MCNSEKNIFHKKNNKFVTLIIINKNISKEYLKIMLYYIVLNKKYYCS